MFLDWVKNHPYDWLMVQKNLLIVDDDKRFIESLHYALSPIYKVFCASSFAQAEKILTETQINAILLDYNLGLETGHTFLDHLRSRNLEIPVIVVSGCLTLEMSIGFLKRRVFDFIEKPASLDSIKQSVALALKNQSSPNNLKIDYATRKVSYGNQPINLTPTEFQILQFFINNQGQQLSRDQIVNFVWGNRQVSKNSFDTHLINLKRKLPDFGEKLTSVYGTGYCYEV